MKKKSFLEWYKSWKKDVKRILMQVQAIRMCKHNYPRAFVTKIVYASFIGLIRETGSICVVCGRLINVNRMYPIVSFNKDGGKS